MIGIWANSSRHPPIAENGFTPFRIISCVFAWLKPWKSSLYFSRSFSISGLSFSWIAIIFMFICVCFLLGTSRMSRTMTVSTTMHRAQFGTTRWITASSQCIRLVKTITRSLQ